MIHTDDVEVIKKGNGISVRYIDANRKSVDLPVDMVVLSPAIKPPEDAANLSKILGISLDEFGFLMEADENGSSVVTSKPGIFIAGCSQGPKNIQESVSQANAAVGKILSSI